MQPQAVAMALVSWGNQNRLETSPQVTARTAASSTPLHNSMRAASR